MKMVSGVKWTVAILLLFGLVVTMAGCGGSSSLVGKWKEDSANGINIEFYPDGTVNFNGGISKWKTENNQIIFTDFSRWAGPVGYKISGSTLTLTPRPPAYPITLKKVKK